MSNCILIVIDSVRYDHCTEAGYFRNTTPFLDSIESLQFETTYSNAPYTAASMPSFLTSTLPLEDGHIVYRDEPPIPDYIDADYTTCAAFNNVQIERFGYDNYFDQTINLSRPDGKQPAADLEDSAPSHSLTDRIKNEFVKILDKNERAKATVVDFYHRFNEVNYPHPSDHIVFEHVQEWLADIDDPYFCYLHCMDTHGPYYFTPDEFEEISEREFDPHKYARLLARAGLHAQSGDYLWELSESQQEYLIAAYDASIYHFDKQLKQFLNTIDTDDTTVIITSDHGQEFWDHGHYGHAGRPSKPRQMTLYEEMICVPLHIIGEAVPADTVQNPVSLVDILPTVLDAINHTRPPDILGQSLLNAEADNFEADRDPIIAHATCPGDPAAFVNEDRSYSLAAVRDGEYKYIHYDDTRKDELYQISSDKNERHNLIGEELPDNSKTVRSLRNKAVESLNGKSKDETSPEDRDLEAQLRRLGYKQ